MGTTSTAPSPPSTRTVSPDRRNESEAQRRGIYGYPKPPISDVAYIGRWKLKRSRGDDATDRSPKRRRNAEGNDDEPGTVSDNDRPPPRYPRKNRRRACNAHKLTESASSLIREEAFKEVPISSRGTVPDTTGQASQSQSSAPIGEGAIVLSKDPRLRPREAVTPGEICPVEPRMLGESPRNSFPPKPFGVSTASSPSAFQQGEYQPHSSGQRDAYVPPAFSRERDDVSGASGRKKNRHSPALTPNEGHPSQAPTLNEDQSSQAPTHHEDHLILPSAPSGHLAYDGLDIIEVRIQAFEEEEHVKQKQHEEQMTQKRRQQKRELELELEEKINKKRRDADVSRQADLQRQDDEHERGLTKVRQL